MRKLFLIVVLMIAVVFVGFAEDDSAISVSIWASADDSPRLQEVLTSELSYWLNKSEDWDFVIDNKNPRNTDIHLIVQSLAIDLRGGDGYAWTISYTPLFAPEYTNSTVATSSRSVSDMEWIAEQSVRRVENMLSAIVRANSSDNT